MEDYFRIGVITQTHGVRGEVKVFPTTDDKERFKKLKKCYIHTDKEDIEVEKSSCKFFKNLVILSFKGFDNINDIEKYKGCDLIIDRKDAVPLAEDEFYISDAIGAEAYLEDGARLGTVKDVIKTGANDVFVITIENKAIIDSADNKDNNEVLVPIIKEFVPEMDIDNKRITVRLMKGMLD